MLKIGRTLAAVGAGLTLATSSGQAQTLFTGSGCADDSFLFCASWTVTYIDVTHLSVFVTNLSQNTNSAFTQVAIGNVAFADPQGMAATTGWQFDASTTGFSGLGLLNNQFGASTTNGVNHALVDGTSLLYQFTFGASIGTFSEAQAATVDAQFAIKDQGFSVPGCSSKVVMTGTATGALGGCSASNGGSSVGGSSSVVPEPSTYVLIAAGLAGLFVVSRWRRAGSRETI